MFHNWTINARSSVFIEIVFVPFDLIDRYQIREGARGRESSIANRQPRILQYSMWTIAIVVLLFVQEEEEETSNMEMQSRLTATPMNHLISDLNCLQ